MADDSNVQLSLEEYEALKAAAAPAEEEAPKGDGKPWWQAPDERGWIWIAPEYFSRWRLFPRATPGAEQAGLVSVIVGAGAAWFGLYVNSTSTDHSKD